MDIRPVNTEADYRAALKEIESLMMAKADSPEGEKLDILTTLVEAYESRHYPIDMPDPIVFTICTFYFSYLPASCLILGHGYPCCQVNKYLHAA